MQKNYYFKIFTLKARSESLLAAARIIFSPLPMGISAMYFISPLRINPLLPAAQK